MVAVVTIKNPVDNGKCSAVASTAGGGTQSRKVVGTRKGGIRLLVCGSRDFDQFDFMHSILVTYFKHNSVEVLIHGGAKGADSMAGGIAKWFGIPTDVYPADWKKHGKAAGPVRNRYMLEMSRPTHAMAFFNKVKTPGTTDMVKLLDEAGIPVQVYGLEY